MLAVKFPPRPFVCPFRENSLIACFNSTELPGIGPLGNVAGSTSASTDRRFNAADQACCAVRLPSVSRFDATTALEVAFAGFGV